VLTGPQRMLRAVCWQSVFYLAAFLVTYPLWFAVNIVQTRTSFQFCLAVLVLTPLQGFFNFLVFIRPLWIRYYKERQKRSKKPFWSTERKIFRQILRHSDVPNVQKEVLEVVPNSCVHYQNGEVETKSLVKAKVESKGTDPHSHSSLVEFVPMQHQLFLNISSASDRLQFNNDGDSAVLGDTMKSKIDFEDIAESDLDKVRLEI
jgi:hypothetical protein